MNLANVPSWAWILLGCGVVFFILCSGLLERLVKKTATGSDAASGGPFSLLDSLQGYKTRLAAAVVALLAANELWHFIPDQYVPEILYLARALGLYGLRDAVERLKQKVDQLPIKS